MSTLMAWLHSAWAGWFGPPRPTATGNAASEAAAVRELAFQVIGADPRFASELYAAADRHEDEHRAKRPGIEARVRPFAPAASKLMLPAA